MGYWITFDCELFDRDCNKINMYFSFYRKNEEKNKKGEMRTQRMDWIPSTMMMMRISLGIWQNDSRQNMYVQ